MKHAVLIPLIILLATYAAWAILAHYTYLPNSVLAVAYVGVVLYVSIWGGEE